MDGISVITPSLNQGSYLRQCLKSIELQAGSINIEHIIVDAGSSDETHDAVAQFSFAELIAIEGCSQSEALNWGFRHAKYNIICWLNADDILFKDAFSTILSMKDEFINGNCLVYSDYVEMDKDLDSFSYRAILPFSPFVVRNFAIYLPTSGAFFSKNIVNSGVTLKDDLHYLMDREFYLQLKRNNVKFIKLTKPLAGFRLHEKQKSAKGKNLAQRSEERALINSQYGGLWVGGRRLLPWNKLFEFFGYLYIGFGCRIMSSYALFSRRCEKELTLAKKWTNRLASNVKGF
jgi:glycosyltransferase involved in cell wall biosynthesis